jgi:hypothetical protein
MPWIITKIKISETLRTTLDMAGKSQRSVAVGVVIHLSKPSEHAGFGHGRCKEPLL